MIRGGPNFEDDKPISDPEIKKSEAKIKKLSEGAAHKKSRQRF